MPKMATASSSRTSQAYTGGEGRHTFKHVEQGAPERNLSRREAGEELAVGRLRRLGSPRPGPRGPSDRDRTLAWAAVARQLRQLVEKEDNVVSERAGTSPERRVTQAQGVGMISR
jgi:hypothetical protein